jgi:hypothetical protein
MHHLLLTVLRRSLLFALAIATAILFASPALVLISVVLNA